MKREAWERIALSPTEIRHAVGELMSARICGDLDRLMEFFAPDVIMHCNCSKEGLFASGVLRGPEAIRGNLTRIDEEYRADYYEIQDILVEDSCAWFRWRAIWRHLGSNFRFTMDLAHFMRWRGSRVAEIHEYLDVPTPYHLGHAIPSPQRDILATRSAGLGREEIVARTKALADYRLHSGPNIELVSKYFSPNVVSEFVGNRARIPYAGRHIGLAALLNVLATVNIEFEQSNPTLTDIIVDGDQLAARRSTDWRHRGTGRQGRVELAEFLRFENGLIVELIEFRDNVTVLEMQGDLEICVSNLERR